MASRGSFLVGRTRTSRARERQSSTMHWLMPIGPSVGMNQGAHAFMRDEGARHDAAAARSSMGRRSNSSRETLERERRGSREVRQQCSTLAPSNSEYKTSGYLWFISASRSSAEGMRQESELRSQKIRTQESGVGGVTEWMPHFCGWLSTNYAAPDFDRRESSSEMGLETGLPSAIPFGNSCNS